jgi:tRNA (cytidine32/uridine32-2'-O)-methyltransferase
MNPASVDVVLVRPARAANVAAACRAMKNMGLSGLSFVGPDPRPLPPEARALAYGAWDVLDGARVSASLAEATESAGLVVGTSGRLLADAWSARRLAREGGALAGVGRVALVFGPEATGLRREELDLCHVRVHIPTEGDQPSLNLAQAVLILAYEIRLSAETAPAETESPQRATSAESEAALEDLRLALLEIGYLNPQSPRRLIAELRRLLARAAPTARETNLLRGMARQILWAARRV